MRSHISCFCVANKHLYLIPRGAAYAVRYAPVHGCTERGVPLPLLASDHEPQYYRRSMSAGVYKASIKALTNS